MASNIRWLLPEGVDEILPPRALQIERLRSRLVNLYVDSGYELIMPPILEFSDTLGGVAHDELSEVSFTFNDVLSGKNISLRPDISSQAARIDAYRMDSIATSKLCYVGDVIKSKSSAIGSRLTVQAGAEIFGDSSIEADIECIELMITSLNSIGIQNITLSLGHAGLMNIVLNYFCKLIPGQEEEIRSALATKSSQDIKEISLGTVDQEDQNLLIAITELFGGKDTLKKAEKIFMRLGPSAESCISYMQNIISKLSIADTNIHIDLGEIQGFKYHNGLTFSTFIDKAGYPLSKGGRYDGISKLDDPRPAVGFDIDLVAASNFTNFDLNAR